MRQQSEKLEITQHNIRDHAHTKMQVSNYVIKSVAFPHFHYCKIYVFTLCAASVTSVSVVQRMFHEGINISNVICNSEWHLKILNILYNVNNLFI